jgi:chemotaxis protein methyltransferase CheR
VPERLGADVQLSAETFRDLRQSVHKICGLVISDDKEYLIRDRLGPTITQMGITSFESLCRRLKGNPDDELIEAVIDAVTTRETSFFRDPHVFEALKEHLFPLLAKEATTRRRSVRIWSAATANGQEAYSLAMLAYESTKAAPSSGTQRPPFALLASDISRAALHNAKTGIYDAREVARGISPSRLAQFFRPEGNRHRILSVLSSVIDFQKVNLCEPFSHVGMFDLICCRNVMIYFDAETRQKISRQFHAQLHEGGWLLLGSAENLYGISTDFESVRLGAAMLYRKKGG